MNAQYWNTFLTIPHSIDFKHADISQLLDSNEIWQFRDVCVFEINGMEVFM